MHKGTKQLLWDAVSMTLWATAENTVGIVVANLPLLRKPFEKLYKSWLGSTITGNTNPATPSGTYNSFMMQSHLSRATRKSRGEGLKGYGTRLPGESDDESDKAILQQSENEGQSYMPSGGILKTTKVTVVEDGKSEHTATRDGP